MNLQQALEAFYKAEVNVELSSFFDGGWTIKIGDRANGYREYDTMFYNLQHVADWLMHQYHVMGLGAE